MYLVPRQVDKLPNPSLVIKVSKQENKTAMEEKFKHFA